MIVVFPDDTHLLFLVGPTSQMLHTKSQGHQLSGSGEEDFNVFHHDQNKLKIELNWPNGF